MGTRSITVFHEQPKRGGGEIAVMYRHMDGYPEGQGDDLAEILKPLRIVNGLACDGEPVANGAACLAAQVVAAQKTEAGGFYLYPAGKRDFGEEYIYHVLPQDDGSIHLSVSSGRMTAFGEPGDEEDAMRVLFRGPVAEFDSATCFNDEDETA